MSTLSYKQYLQFLEKKPRRSLVKKFLVVTLTLLLTALGSISSYLYYQYQKEAPQRAENQYLEVAFAGLNSNRDATQELLESLQVAGAKVKTIDQQKDKANSELGFYTSLDDISRILSKLEAIKENSTIQKSQLTKIARPQKFVDLNNELVLYFDETITVVENLQKEHQFVKEVLLALGPRFYTTGLSDESLWQTGKNAEIVKYYEEIKLEADTSLAKLYKLDPLQSFRPYFENQIAYFERQVKAANNIILVLSQEEKVDKDEASRLEEAYQVLTGARRENEELSSSLLSQRLAIFSVEENLQKIATLKTRQSLLENKFNDLK